MRTASSFPEHHQGGHQRAMRTDDRSRSNCSGSTYKKRTLHVIMASGSSGGDSSDSNSPSSSGSSGRW